MALDLEEIHKKHGSVQLMFSGRRRYVGPVGVVGEVKLIERYSKEGKTRVYKPTFRLPIDGCLTRCR